MPNSPRTHRAKTIKAKAHGYDQGRRRNDKALAYAAKVRSSYRWQKLRARHRQEHPLCCDPFGDHDKHGTIGLNENSHHIMPLVTHPDLAYDMDNLAALCTYCHGKIEVMERAGQKTYKYFNQGST